MTNPGGWKRHAPVKHTDTQTHKTMTISDVMHFCKFANDAAEA